jgi:flagellar M-ring protein FliF
VPEPTTSTVTPPGSIERLSVAVAVSKHLTPTMQRALTKLVAQAAGLDPARGDRLSLVGIPFNTSAATVAARAIAQAETTTQYEHWAEELVLLVLGVILLRALGQAFRRWQRAPRPAAAPAGGDAVPGEDVTQSVAGLLRQIKAEPRPSPGDVALQQVTGLVKENPDSVARLIRSWMTEEEG